MPLEAFEVVVLIARTAETASLLSRSSWRSAERNLA
jgi:hypothetical protein